MKKKQCCFCKRFAALVAALNSCFSFSVPAFAASDTEADMPSLDDFYSHHGSWFVWRKLIYSGIDCFELLCSPIAVSGSSYTLPYSISYSTDAFDVSYLANDSGLAYDYACAFPYPLRGASGLWSELPSFPIGFGFSPQTSVVRVYSTSPQPSGTYGFLTSSFSRSDRILSFGNTAGSSSGSSTDTLDSFTFSSPFYSYPFAFRESTSSSASGYVLQGGDSSFIVPPSNYSDASVLHLGSTRFLRGTNSFVPYPSGYTIPSSDIGFVFVKQPSSSPVYSASAFDTTGSFAFSLLVPASRLPDVRLGDWISDSPEDLQDAITNQFHIDSGALKNSEDNLNSWNSSSSVDSDVASGASGLLVGLFQNLGTFLFSVSLLCFGAVVLRMLIRKAVDG
ncbi:protein C [uncultured phage WW-nAnB]|uniref:protein C n=1 Tax=uncultured phage WW-nAnB TaxID=1074044 RepID=UPI00022BE20B|nr:protein C [uncultured phage WW-nAnB]AEP81819.1 protein C [uncultured phage WW-nAnB]